ncbi:motility protein A [Stakelama sediminis]|uniref:Chemotaxis protein MotA n=1 Tax=Stakelama sediminis TaxID=463200 RepID=A0A840YWT6_9SPHN|nr:MotA/TolQ/ExbB proton channel family protein [Stakelama sediminis]MBB5718017.1 chemotaxis protein MotA [Stakelama sediminis]
MTGFAFDPAFAQAMAPFLDPVALAIVVGGTVLAMFLRTPLADLGRAVAALRVLPRRRWQADRSLEQITALSRIAARHGALALDRSIIRDPDIACAVEAIVDGKGPEQVELLLETRQLVRSERHLATADVWAGMADVAPAMGMIGTLIGLVRMFLVMTDPDAIGGAMAVALLTTLYGALIASLIAMPVATRLRRQARSEALERTRLIAPLVALAARERPRLKEAAA